MVSISYLKGDATVPVGRGNRVICHVCNDIGGWGRGFVLALSKRWKEPETQYRAWYKLGSTGGFRLGTIQYVRATRGGSSHHASFTLTAVPPC